MKKYYFVGGPRKGHAEVFFKKLEEIGGAPANWRIYPHADDDRALHIIDTDDINEIQKHLDHFNGIYERGDIKEVLDLEKHD